MNITTEQIKALREQTGVSVMLCRKALEEAKGDIEKAKVILQRKGADAAAKKADRTLGAGTVASYIHHGGTVGVLIELSSETDFVSGNEAFKALAYDIAMHIAASKPEYVKREDVSEETLARAKEVLQKEVEGKPKEMQEKILEGKLNSFFAEKILLEQPFIKNPDQTIRNLIENAVQKFGEKIEVSRFVRYAAGNR
ncbi:MAG: Elongation factor Ts [Parcubacteria group bacterium GW2011_GWA2_49_9]|nr:MAG: Elongation factor Ts [Parcubacteria group bacterium GW2011_GWA2_49_9]